MSLSNPGCPMGVAFFSPFSLLNCQIQQPGHSPCDFNFDTVVHDRLLKRSSGAVA